MSGALTIDEVRPGSSTALGSGPALCVCVRVMSVYVEAPCPWPAADWTGLWGFVPLMFCHTRVQVSVTALGSGPSE